jgi:hypothetical protein
MFDPPKGSAPIMPEAELKRLTGLAESHNHVSLQAETAQNFCLSIWSSSSKCHKGVSSHTVNILLELSRFEVSKFFGLTNFELFEVFAFSSDQAIFFPSRM